MKTGNLKSTASILILSAIMIFSAVMAIFSFKKTNDNTVNDRQIIADNCTAKIIDFTENAEKLLNDYTDSDEIKKAVNDPENKESLKTAQDHSEKYTADNPLINDIYASRWSTSEVIVHSQEKYAGIITRKGDNLITLQNELKETGNGIYSAGFAASPVEEKTVLLMYKTVFDTNSDPAGYTGISMKTQDLFSSIEASEIKGLKNAVFRMVNVSNLKYIFPYTPSENIQYNDPENNTVSADEIVSLCNDLKNSDSDQKGNLTFSEDSIKYSSSYTYLSDREWLIMIGIPKSSGFSFSAESIICSAVFCISLAGLLILIIKRKKNS